MNMPLDISILIHDFIRPVPDGYTQVTRGKREKEIAQHYVRFLMGSIPHIVSTREDKEIIIVNKNKRINIKGINIIIFIDTKENKLYFTSKTLRLWNGKTILF